MVAEPNKLKRVLLELDCIGGAGWRVRGSQSRLEIVRYKPERRLILSGKLDLKRENPAENWRPRVFLRFFTDSRGNRIMTTLETDAAKASAASPAESSTGSRIAAVPITSPP